jgi:hypothetical protein
MGEESEVTPESQARFHKYSERALEWRSQNRARLRKALSDCRTVNESTVDKALLALGSFHSFAIEALVGRPLVQGFTAMFDVSWGLDAFEELDGCALGNGLTIPADCVVMPATLHACVDIFNQGYEDFRQSDLTISKRGIVRMISGAVAFLNLAIEGDRSFQNMADAYWAWRLARGGAHAIPKT